VSERVTSGCPGREGSNECGNENSDVTIRAEQRPQEGAYREFAR